MMSPSGSDSWQPLSVEEAVGILQGASFRWWISGGHALELHMGDQWREHDDFDVGICRAETAVVHAGLVGWDLWLAAAGELSPWNGRPLTLREHENNVWARRSVQEKWAMDLTLNECTEESWIYRRDPSVTSDWDAAVLKTASGHRLAARWSHPQPLHLQESSPNARQHRVRFRR